MNQGSQHSNQIWTNIVIILGLKSSKIKHSKPPKTYMNTFHCDNPWNPKLKNDYKDSVRLHEVLHTNLVIFFFVLRLCKFATDFDLLISKWLFASLFYK